MDVYFTLAVASVSSGCHAPCQCSVVDFTAMKGTRARNYTNEVINRGKQMIESGRLLTRYNLGNRGKESSHIRIGGNSEILHYYDVFARRQKLCKLEIIFKQTPVNFFYRKNMKSFFNYVTTTLRALFA